MNGPVSPHTTMDRMTRTDFSMVPKAPMDVAFAQLDIARTHMYVVGQFFCRARMAASFDPIVAAVPPNSHVLDVGCGEGLLLGLLIELGRASTAVGFDTSAGAIRNARDMAQASGLGASAVFKHLDDDSKWPTEDGPFDVVTMIDVMHHLKPAEQGRIWTRIAGTLRPGGLLRKV